MTINESKLCSANNVSPEINKKTVQNRTLRATVCVSVYKIQYTFMLTSFKSILSIQTDNFCSTKLKQTRECHKKHNLGPSFNLHLGSKYHYPVRTPSVNAKYEK